MKKFLIALLSLVALAVANDVAFSTSVSYEDLGISKTISATTSFDTLSGVDSSTLAINYIPVKGCETILVRDALSGAGADSTFALVYVDALDGSGNLLFRSLVDTIVSANSVTIGGAYSLPMFGGTKYRVKLVSTAATGGVDILNRMYLVSRRIIEIHKPWN